MFSATDYDKLQQIMEESPEKKELLTRLLDSHRMTVSTISHEIRNPLTLVYSTLQLMAVKYPEIVTFKYWDQLISDVEYIKLLLEELSSYNNGDNLKLTQTDSAGFFKAISLSFAASLTETNIEYKSSISPDLPCMSLDSVKLRQVLLNLLGNAKEAVTSCENPHPEITMKVHAENSKTPNIVVQISDNGCGISPEHLEHIFEPFITYKNGGTGLGLAIADRIISAHKGSLTVASAPGKLTTFTLTLPIQ